jgi:RNA polymerase sigma factor (TIGR02999 family)
LPDHDLTQLLERVSRGDAAANGDLLARVYGELRQLAGSQLRRESPGHTLQPTALVNEAYLRLFGTSGGWANRRHFFGAAARAMRQVLVDHARRRDAEKRGGGYERLTLSAAENVGVDAEAEVLQIADLLDKLEARNERLARIVELRYFAGLDIEATADVLEISPATVKRDWAYARAWLLQQLDPGGAPA